MIVLPPPNMADLPLSSVAELARWGTAGADSQPIRLRGVVLAVEGDRRIFLQDHSGSLMLYIRRNESVSLVPGDEIEARGYPALVGKRWVLQDVVVRWLRHGSPPLPLDLDECDDDPALHDANLVRITGTVIEAIERQSGANLLLLQTTRGIVEVHLPAYVRALPEHNAYVEATGIAEVSTRMTLSGITETLQLQILALPPGGLRVLRSAPWWNPQRLRTAIVLVSGGMLWFGAWALSLRRIVRKQAARLRDNVRAETVWHERTRIARDIHDNVGAVLTQISLMCEQEQDETSDIARKETIQRIGDAARGAVEALDQIVWAVNPSNDRVDRTVSYCCRLVHNLVEGLPVRFRVDISNDLPTSPISAGIRHHLAMALKEAACNALRHANATEIRLAARCDHDRLTVEITDNGCGFNPVKEMGRRSGLENIRNRMAAINGSVRFQSGPSGGTVVVLEVPIADPYLN